MRGGGGRKLRRIEFGAVEQSSPRRVEIETRRDERVREKKEITREASSIVSERAWRGYERERERERGLTTGWRRTKERRIDGRIEKESERAGMTR